MLCVYVDVVVVYIITKRVDLSVKHIRPTREKVPTVEIRTREDSNAAGYVYKTNDSLKKKSLKENTDRGRKGIQPSVLDGWRHAREIYRFISSPTRIHKKNDELGSPAALS